MSHATWAFGTKLLKGATPICELSAINGLNLTSDEIDVTSHCSEGGYEEVIQTIRRTGTVSLEGNFYPGDPGRISGRLPGKNHPAGQHAGHAGPQ